MSDVKIDSNNIEEMYIKYYTPLKRYCIKLVSYNSRYTAIAEDCVQEAFYRVSVRPRILHPVRTSMAGWLLVARTICCHTSGK